MLDGDVVELSNLHRQHLHWTPQIGRPKAHSAVAKLQLLNPDVMVEPYQVRMDEDNAEGLVLGHDLVVDCSDAFATRYLVNRACCESGTLLVEGGVLGLSRDGHEHPARVDGVLPLRVPGRAGATARGPACSVRCRASSGR